MDALLYNGNCTLDGAGKSGRALVRRMASGDVTLVTPFMHVRFSACEVAGRGLRSPVAAIWVGRAAEPLSFRERNNLFVRWSGPGRRQDCPPGA